MKRARISFLVWKGKELSVAPISVPNDSNKQMIQHAHSRTLLTSRNWFTAPSPFHAEDFSFIEAKKSSAAFVRGIFWACRFLPVVFSFSLQMCEMLVSQENQAIFGLLNVGIPHGPYADWILLMLFSST